MPVPPVENGSTVQSLQPATPSDLTTEHPLVAFVPGLGLGADEWTAVRDGLRRPSVVVLLPSLGQPASRRGDLSAEAQATRLLESLPEATPLILVGHSASCPIVVNAAARSGDVIGLVLVGPVTDPAAQSWPQMLRQWDAPRPKSEFPIAQPRAPVLAHRPREHVAGNERLAPLPHRPGAPVANRAGRDHSCRRDRIATQDWSSELARVSHAHLTAIDDAAHMVPMTHPDVVTAAVAQIRGAARRHTQDALT